MRIMEILKLKKVCEEVKSYGIFTEMRVRHFHSIKMYLKLQKNIKKLFLVIHLV